MSDAPDDPLGNAWLVGQTVLLVEDNLIVGMAAAESLTMLGAVDVIITTSAEQADGRVTTSKPDLAILDINLGSGTSFVLARRLSALGVPFIFASGYGADADRPDDLRQFPIVTKPYRREQLAAVIWALLNGNDGLPDVAIT